MYQKDAMVTGIEQLLQSTLVLVAHPDDESLGCGILLQRIADTTVLLCTDGAPAITRPWYSRIFPGRESYAEKRLSELRAALKEGSVRQPWTMPDIQAERLYVSLERAAAIIAGC